MSYRKETTTCASLAHIFAPFAFMVASVAPVVGSGDHARTLLAQRRALAAHCRTLSARSRVLGASSALMVASVALDLASLALMGLSFALTDAPWSRPLRT